jgi:hypothetical protein
MISHRHSVVSRKNEILKSDSCLYKSKYGWWYQCPGSGQFFALQEALSSPMSQTYFSVMTHEYVRIRV